MGTVRCLKARTRKRICIHSHAHPRTHTRTHTQTHKHTPSSPAEVGQSLFKFRFPFCKLPQKKSSHGKKVETAHSESSLATTQQFPLSLDTTNIGKCSTHGAVSTDTKNTAQCSGFGMILTTGEGSFRTRSARRRTRTAHSSIDTGCFRFILLRSIGQRKQNFGCVSQDHVPDEGEVPGGSGQTRRDRGRGAR